VSRWHCPAVELTQSWSRPGFLLKPGRKYEDAVKAFQPYDRTQEVNEEARKAGFGMIVEGERYEPRRKTYVYVNNRLEGNALETIAAMLDLVEPTFSVRI
jgi:hypothetical protein